MSRAGAVLIRATTLALLAVALVAPAMAPASSSHPVGTAFSLTTDPAGVDPYVFDVVGFMTNCESTLGGTINAVYGSGSGLRGAVGSTSFSGCTLAGTPTWTLDLTPIAPALNEAYFTNVRIVVTLFGAPCTYTGDLTGTHDEWADLVTIDPAGTNLTKSSGGFICPSSPAVDTTYVLSPTTLDVS